uniref:Protein ABHD8 n=1 Tax=Eptatretus burgeri TaxID=7764 RepID=A0A8C4N644_EPTBU
MLCCCGQETRNSVGPHGGTVPAPVSAPDGFDMVEVLPGRVLRVRHAFSPHNNPAPLHQPTDCAPTAVRCRRRITVYKNGQVCIEDLVDDIPAAATDVESSSGDGGAASEQPPQRRSRRSRRTKRTVLVDRERSITTCRATDPDLVLFFFHGVGGALDVWREQLGALAARGYECVAPDMLGHGGSSTPTVAAAYTFNALAEDAKHVFRRYAKRRNVLVGHSYGVSFCVHIAHEFPDLVSKLVLINGGGPTALEPSVCSLFSLPPCVLHCLSPCLTWAFLKAGFAHQGVKEKQLLKDGHAFSLSPFVLRATMGGQYWPEGDEAFHAELTVPTLIVHGRHDRLVPLEEDKRMAEILLIAFLKVVEEGSHMVMLECPEAVNTLLQDFLLWEYRDMDSPRAEQPVRTEATKPFGTTGGVAA